MKALFCLLAALFFAMAYSLIEYHYPVAGILVAIMGCVFIFVVFYDWVAVLICSHDDERLEDSDFFGSPPGINYTKIYRCKKCGRIKKERVRNSD